MLIPYQLHCIAYCVNCQEGQFTLHQARAVIDNEIFIDSIIDKIITDTLLRFDSTNHKKMNSINEEFLMRNGCNSRVGDFLTY